MKKILLTALFLFCTGSSAFAQFGIKGGYNMSTFNGDNQYARTLTSPVPVSPTVAKDLTGGISYDIGLFLGFSLQPEALYTQRGAIYEDAIGKTTFKSEYVDIPLLLKFELPIPIITIYAEGGASYSFLLSAKRTDEAIGGSAIDTDIKDSMTKNDLSYIYGVGLKILFLEADVRYVLGQKSIYANSGNTKTTNKGLMATVGIRF